LPARAIIESAAPAGTFFASRTDVLGAARPTSPQTRTNHGIGDTLSHVTGFANSFVRTSRAVVAAGDPLDALEHVREVHVREVHVCGVHVREVHVRNVHGSEARPDVAR
jgi:hypothetical protein